MKKSFKSL